MGEFGEGAGAMHGMAGAPIGALAGPIIGGTFTGALGGFGIGALGGGLLGMMAGGPAGALGGAALGAIGGAGIGGGLGFIAGALKGISGFTNAINQAANNLMALSQRFRGESVEWARFYSRMQRFRRELLRREARQTEEAIPELERMTKSWTEFAFNIRMDLFRIFRPMMERMTEVSSGLQIYMQDAFRRTMGWLGGVRDRAEGQEGFLPSLARILIPEGIENVGEGDPLSQGGRSGIDVFSQFFGRQRNAADDREEDSEAAKNVAEEIRKVEEILKEFIGEAIEFFKDIPTTLDEFKELIDEILAFVRNFPNGDR